MDVKETLIMMRERYDDKAFSSAVEGMKRRADRGLLEGVTADDIERCLNGMSSPHDDNGNGDDMNLLIAETQDAIDYYDNLNEDSMTDDEIDGALLEAYINAMMDEMPENICEGLFRRKKKKSDDGYEDDEGNPYFGRTLDNRSVAAGAGITAGAGAAAAGIGVGIKKGIDSSVAAGDKAWRDPYNAAYAANYVKPNYDPAKTTKLAADAADASAHKAASDAALKAAGAEPTKLSKWWTGLKWKFKQIPGKIAKIHGEAAKKVAGLSVGAKAAIHAGVGAATLAGIYGLYKLHRRRQARMGLREDASQHEYFFDDDVMAYLAECAIEMPGDSFLRLYESDDELIRDISESIAQYMEDMCQANEPKAPINEDSIPGSITLGELLA